MYQRTFTDTAQYLPELTGNGIEIKHFQMSKFEVIRACMQGGWMNSGLRENHTYTKLYLNGNLWMSDTPMEKRSNNEFIRHANGNVLIFGLGIGLIIYPLLNDENIKSITVIEKNKELIDLLLPILKSYDTNNVLQIIEGDAFEYHSQIAKETKFDTIYFDIWVDICTDNYESIKKVEKPYRKFLNRENPNCFFNSWLKEYYQSEIRREKRSSYSYY